jgi:hypothetical protein
MSAMTLCERSGNRRVRASYGSLAGMVRNQHACRCSMVSMLASSVLRILQNFLKSGGKGGYAH